MPLGLGSVIARDRLAVELRALRGERKASDVGRKLGFSEAKVCRYERAGDIPPPIGEVEKLLDLYGVRGSRRARLLALAAEARQRNWWHSYEDALLPGAAEVIGYEQGAARLYVWQPEVVPPQLQTEEYAWVLLGARERIERVPPGVMRRRLSAQMMRRHVAGIRPVQVSVVLDEAVLHRPVGGTGVLREQLAALIALPEHVTVHVLPARMPARLVFTGPFTLIQFEDDRDGEEPPQDVVALDQLNGSVVLRGERGAFLYWLAWDVLREAALGVEASRALLAEAANLAARS